MIFHLVCIILSENNEIEICSVATILNLAVIIVNFKINTATLECLTIISD